MAADDVAMALVAMEDAQVRQRVRKGDLDALGDLRLSSKEEQLVKAAASEEADPEVEGFEWGSSATFAAIGYAQGNIYDGGVQKRFAGYVGGRYGAIGDARQANCVCPPKKPASGMA